MESARTLTVVLCALAAAGAAAAGPAAGAQPDAAHRALLDRYCVTCHNERMSGRGAVPFSFDGLDPADVGADP